MAMNGSFYTNLYICDCKLGTCWVNYELVDTALLSVTVKICVVQKFKIKHFNANVQVQSRIKKKQHLRTKMFNSHIF